MTELRAPFPYFGGKSRVADVVWQAFGTRVPQYFFGSGAVLLGRPDGAGKVETVNDADGLLVNFWRSVQIDPGETAKWADWPISDPGHTVVMIAPEDGRVRLAILDQRRNLIKEPPPFVRDALYEALLQFIGQKMVLQPAIWEERAE